MTPQNRDMNHKAPHDRCAAILWDMDGTLIDTEPLWGQATYAMSEAMGRRITDDVRALTVGGTTENTIAICSRYAGLSLSSAEIAQWKRWMFDKVGELFRQGIAMRPQVRELLLEGMALQTETHQTGLGLRMGLVTNTSRELTTIALEAIRSELAISDANMRSVFAVSICGDEVPNGKPAPDPYVRACAELGVDPHQTLVIEDSTTGMKSARDAGCRVLGVPVDDDTSIPEGITILEELNGSTDLSGTTLQDLLTLFSRLQPHMAQ